MIDKTLSGINSKIIKEAYDDAFYLLEALTVFFDCESAWPSESRLCVADDALTLVSAVSDDGERTIVTNKAYGVLLVALLTGLQKEGRLDKAHFPALESFLKRAAEWGDSMKGLNCKSDYDLVCKAFGEQLFEGKSPEDLAVEKAQVEEWIRTLPIDARQEVREEMEEDAEDESDDEDWYAGGKDVSSSMDLPHIWVEYKNYLAKVPKGPMRGPGTWDISAWSASDKKEFAFGDSEEELDSDDN